MKSITSKGYWSEFILEWLFYFSLMMIMLNIINGIIVDNFQSQRQENTRRNKALYDRCYICNDERSDFESKGKDIDYHVLNEHSVMYYFSFIFRIDKSNINDLNIYEYYFKKDIENSQTRFFPTNS